MQSSGKRSLPMTSPCFEGDRTKDKEVRVPGRQRRLGTYGRNGWGKVAVATRNYLFGLLRQWPCSVSGGDRPLYPLFDLVSVLEGGRWTTLVRRPGVPQGNA